MPEADFQVFGDAIKRIGQQGWTEVPGRVLWAPRHAMALIGPQQHAIALLAHVDFAVEVDRVQHHLARFLVEGDDFGHVLGDQVLVLHRQDRQFQTDHTPYLTRPKTAAVDDVLGNDIALVGNNLPATVQALPCIEHSGVCKHLGTGLACRTAEGVSCAVGVYVALNRVVHGADELRLVNQR